MHFILSYNFVSHIREMYAASVWKSYFYGHFYRCPVVKHFLSFFASNKSVSQDLVLSDALHWPSFYFCGE